MIGSAAKRPQLILALVLLLASCGPWERADEFVSGLRCGMTVEEVRAYARDFEGADVRQENFKNSAPVVVTHGDTAIELWVENGNLQAAQITWHDGRPTNISKRPRVELCSRTATAR